MAQKASNLAAILEALPLVQDTVRKDISARIAAGEAIGRVEADIVFSGDLPAGNLHAKRKALLKKSSSAHSTEHKNVA